MTQELYHIGTSGYGIRVLCENMYEYTRKKQMLLTRSYVSVKTAYLPFINANITTFFLSKMLQLSV